MTRDFNTLLVDAGNTSIKWKLGSTGEVYRCAANNFSELEQWIREHISQVDALALSSVQDGQWNKALHSLCSELEVPVWAASSELENSGLKSGYHEPANLGVDRWLAMLALWQRVKAGFLLVDMGTAITIDAVDDEGRHLGGYIVPGLELQRSALINASDSLKGLLADTADYKFGLGLDTSEAVDRGIFISIEALVEKVMRNAGLSDSQLVIIGGDAHWFVDSVELNADSGNADLVLQGLEIAFNQVKKSGELK